MEMATLVPEDQMVLGDVSIILRIHGGHLKFLYTHQEESIILTYMPYRFPARTARFTYYEFKKRPDKLTALTLSHVRTAYEKRIAEKSGEEKEIDSAVREFLFFVEKLRVFSAL